MQREHPCYETRPSGVGPWDGFGDFTVHAISNYLLGSVDYSGQVDYRGSMVDYQFKDNYGYPRVTLQNGQRLFTRHASQPQNTFIEDYIKLPGSELLEQEVYVISGSIHVNDPSFNIIYDPIQYTGTLLPTINPTDPTMFATLQNLTSADAPNLYDQTRDVTLKLTYTDGTINHVLVPFHTSDRIDDQNPNDPVGLDYFSVIVPGDVSLCNVEMYRRAFIISDPGNPTPGNINDPSQNITAANFMNAAVLMKTLDYSCNCPGTPGYIPPGTPCDDGNPYTINDIEDGFCNCTGTRIPTCGQITNTDFVESIVGWRSWACDVSSTNEQALITNISLGDAGFGFDGIEVDEGESYTARFDASSVNNRTISVTLYGELMDNGDPGTEFLDTIINITTVQESYALTFTTDTSGVNALLEFNFGSDESDVLLDNVCFEKCGFIEIPFNGIDDDCDPSTPDDQSTNIDVLLEEDAISIYPNPTSGIFEIVGPNQNYIIRILASDGTLVQTICYTGTSHNIDISQLPAGLLFIEISNEHNSHLSIRKIIKQ